MKLIEGTTNNLPATVHVEQDGNWFFVLEFPRNHDIGHHMPALAVIKTTHNVGFDLESAKIAQDAIRAFLTARNITATFDY